MTGTAAGGRIAWVDSVKGVAIALVVVFHSAIWTVNAGYAPSWWDTGAVVLETVLMPPFFLVSGLFAAKWMERFLPDLLWIKVWPLMWVFMIWSAIMLAVLPLEARLDGMERDPLKNAVQFLLSPVRPRFEMWFLWTLAVFYVAMWLTRRIAALLQLVLAAAVSVAAFALPAIHEFNVGYSGALKFYVFFLVGVHLRGPVVRLTAKVDARIALAYVVAWSAAVAVFVSANLGRWPVVFAGMAVAGTGFTFALAVLLGRSRHVRRLGAQTMPVYVMHVPVVVVVLTVMVGVGVPSTADAPVGVVMPFVLGAVAIATTLLFSHAVSGGPLRYLFEAPEPPQWLRRRWPGPMAQSSPDSGSSTPNH